jgi:putative membrane protein
MGFGFVVARFGYFLAQVRGTAAADAPRHSALSTGIGVLLVIVGVLMTLAAAAEHRRLLRGLERQVAAAVLAVLGAGLAAYLLVTGR